MVETVVFNSYLMLFTEWKYCLLKSLNQTCHTFSRIFVVTQKTNFEEGYSRLKTERRRRKWILTLYFTY